MGKNILNNAKQLRKNMTDAEKKLWYYLRAARFSDYKFKRQKPIGNYIVDFVAVKQKLIIELDGSQHILNYQYDERRTVFLQSVGYEVLRFYNNDVLAKTTDVLDEIYRVINRR